MVAHADALTPLTNKSPVTFISPETVKCPVIAIIPSTILSIISPKVKVIFSPRVKLVVSEMSASTIVPLTIWKLATVSFSNSPLSLCDTFKKAFSIVPHVESSPPTVGMRAAETIFIVEIRINILRIKNILLLSIFSSFF